MQIVNKFIKHFLFIFIFMNTFCNGKKIKIVKFEAKKDQDVIKSNITYTSSDDFTTLSFTAECEILQEINDFIMTFQVKKSIAGDDKNYQIVLINTKLELCKLQKNTAASIFIQIFLKEFEKNGILTKCPIKKTKIVVPNFSISTLYLPFAPDGEYLTDVKIYGKVGKNRKLQNFMTFVTIAVIYS
ncbi:hypothetical protein ACKWTF_015612 [Chironomus riparius]